MNVLRLMSWLMWAHFDACFFPALLNTKRSILTDLDVSPMADSSKEEKWRWIALLHQIATSLTPNVARRNHLVSTDQIATFLETDAARTTSLKPSRLACQMLRTANSSERAVALLRPCAMRKNFSLEIVSRSPHASH